MINKVQPQLRFFELELLGANSIDLGVCGWIELHAHTLHITYYGEESVIREKKKREGREKE